MVSRRLEAWSLGAPFVQQKSEKTLRFLFECYFELYFEMECEAFAGTAAHAICR